MPPPMMPMRGAEPAPPAARATAAGPRTDSPAATVPLAARKSRRDMPFRRSSCTCSTETSRASASWKSFESRTNQDSSGVRAIKFSSSDKGVSTYEHHHMLARGDCLAETLNDESRQAHHLAAL